MTGSRVAIVTGAARGIGAAVAKRLAADGCAVAVLDLAESDCTATVTTIEGDGGQALCVGTDVGDAGQVSTAVRRVAEEIGPPTVLVNNAGILRDNPLSDMTDRDWDAVLTVHLRGAFLMSREVCRHQVDQGWGRIVNLSSIAALGRDGQANYATAKAGIQGLTRTLALELGQFGVTANAIAPGFIDTGMTIAAAERLGVPYDEFKKAAAARIPVNRVGRPEDVAAVASFLVSEAASFVSGQVLYVAGGPRG